MTSYSWNKIYQQGFTRGYEAAKNKYRVEQTWYGFTTWVLTLALAFIGAISIANTVINYSPCFSLDKIERSYDRKIEKLSIPLNVEKRHA